MKKGKGAFIAIVALVVAAIGVLIALAAYFKDKSSYLYDDEDFLFDDPDGLAYYKTDKDIVEEYDDLDDFDEIEVGIDHNNATEDKIALEY